MGRALAELKIRSFEKQLRSRLRCIAPEAFVPVAASRLVAALDSRVPLGQWPPHVLAHAIEANCAYFSPAMSRPITDDDLRRVINEFHGFDDPYHHHLLTVEQDLDQFLMAIARVQFPVQHNPSKMELAKIYRLLVMHEEMQRADERFLTRHGIRLRDWVACCFVLYAATQGKHYPLVRDDYWHAMPEIGIDLATAKRFLAMVSRTPEVVRDQYLGIRSEVRSPLLWGQIRCGFQQFPAIRLGHGVVVPAPALALSVALEGLDRLIDKEEVRDGGSLARSMERYVVDLLVASDLPRRVVGPKELEGALGTKSADVLAVFSDAILIIECKAASLNTRMVTARALRDSTATGRVAVGLEQIWFTAMAIRSGALVLGNEAASLPIIGAVVTLGDLLMPNSVWRWRHVWEPRLKQLNESICWSEMFQHQPQVLSMTTLEMLLFAARSSQCTPLALYDKKAGIPYTEKGDWGTFLPEFYANADLWPFWEDSAEAFYQRFPLKGTS